tara:strand:- start:4825 stop:6156 length:1332 start_codon:yes stop_codon:yes gene_type:complete
MSITLSQEDFDSIYNGPRPNLSSPTWYMKETGKFHLPYSLGEWNFFTETGEMFDDKSLYQNAYPMQMNPHEDNITWKYEEQLENNEKHIYLCQIYNPDFFKLNKDIGFSVMNQRFQEDVRKGLCKIAIWYPYEGYVQMIEEDVFTPNNTDIEIVESWRIKSNFPKGSVHFVTGNAIASKHPKVVNSGIRVHYLEAFSTWNGKEVDRPVATFNPIDSKNLFLTYNRAPRLARVQFVCKLQEYGILDRGRVSLGSVYEGDGEVPNPVSRHGVLDRDWNKVKKLLPLQINNLTHFFNLACNIVDEDYDTTFCSVVTETLTNRGTVFISEKIWKPIIKGHPFYVLGSKGTLHHLNLLGYRTFDKWFNEEYDDYEDWTARSEAIAKELKRLSKLSNEELTIMREEMQEVLDYNRDHFKYLLNRDYGVNEPGEPQHIIIKTLNNILWGT